MRWSDSVRLGDQVRFLLVALICCLVCGLVVALWAWVSGRPIWWAVPIGMASGLVAGWASWSFFGVANLERIAAHRVHGGRHHYFEQQEVRLVFDQGDGIWLCLDDLRQCIGGDPAAIRHYAPHEATSFEGRGRAVYLSVAGARRYLRLSRHPDLQKFTNWFEAELLAPIERRRERGLPLYGSGEGRV